MYFIPADMDGTFLIRGFKATLLILFVLLSCQQQDKKKPEEDWTAMRAKMVQQQIIARGVRGPKIIAALKSVPRELFVPEKYRASAYEDKALPIGQGQTISQPYIVAFMTQQLHIKPGDRILEIGTGSGYQAAILGQIADSVFSIEIIPELAERARKTIQSLHYDNVLIMQGDGYLGWPDKAPFDAIIVTAAPPSIPPPLLDQLKTGGRMILPVGKYVQELVVVNKTEHGLNMDNVLPVRFVPMTGKIQEKQ